MKRVVVGIAGLLVTLAGGLSADPIVIRTGDTPSDAAEFFGDPFEVLDRMEREDPFQVTGFVTPDRAVTLARDAGLAAGIEPWRAIILFDPELGLPVWRVMNTTRDEGGRIEGRAVRLHAVTGANLGASDWSVHIR